MGNGGYWNWKRILLIVVLVILVIILIWALVSSCRRHRRGDRSRWSFRNLFSFSNSNNDDISQSSSFKQRNLASDVNNTAVLTNPTTVNSWGVYVDNFASNHRRHRSSSSSSSTPSNNVYVANNGSGTVSEFSNDNKNTLTATYTVPLPASSTSTGTSHPTGIDKNLVATAFLAGGTAATTLLVCTEEGLVCALVPSISTTVLQVVIDNSAATAVYKGIAVTPTNLYVTNFFTGFVEVYDTTFTLVSQFQDADIFANGYAPFNVKVFDKSYLIVSFALQDTTKTVDVPGIGSGYVDVFSTAGVMVKRLVDRGHLNSPWGLTLSSSRKLLYVSNVGDGTIHIYKARNGQYVGPVTNCDTTDPLVIDGLWGIDIQSNATNYRSSSSRSGNSYNNNNNNNNGRNSGLYFAAGIQSEAHGLYGKLVTCGGNGRS
jgi:uncharacterized protein (TIGR03118 family)